MNTINTRSKGQLRPAPQNVRALPFPAQKEMFSKIDSMLGWKQVSTNTKALGNAESTFPTHRAIKLAISTKGEVSQCWGIKKDHLKQLTVQRKYQNRNYSIYSTER